MHTHLLLELVQGLVQIAVTLSLVSPMSTLTMSAASFLILISITTWVSVWYQSWVILSTNHRSVFRSRDLC